MPRHAGHLGLELGKTLKLEWHRAANTRTRCLRITAKEEKAVRAKLQVRATPSPSPAACRCAALHVAPADRP